MHSQARTDLEYPGFGSGEQRCQYTVQHASQHFRVDCQFVHKWCEVHLRHQTGCTDLLLMTPQPLSKYRLQIHRVTGYRALDTQYQSRTANAVADACTTGWRVPTSNPADRTPDRSGESLGPAYAPGVAHGQSQHCRLQGCTFRIIFPLTP